MNHEMVPSVKTKPQVGELETIYYGDTEPLVYRAPDGRETAIKETGASLISQEAPVPQGLIVPSDETLLPIVTAEKTPQNDSEKITLVVGGLADGVERNIVRETAQREFDRSMAQGGGRLRRFARGIVKGNYLREYSLLRERKRAQDDIVKTGRLAGMTDDEWHHVTAESIQRVLDDDGSRELIDERAGESREVLDSERGGEIKSLINDMITEYVNGAISRDAIQEETRRRLAELARDNVDAAKLMGAGNVYMTNIADIAETVRGQMNHERGLQDVLDRVEIISAKLNTDVHGEARATKFEQILDKIPVNAAWVSTGLAVMYGVGVGFGKSLLNKATRFGVVSAGSGVMSYFQEKARLTHERAQVGREAAIGESVDGTERRERLAETLYDMKDASMLSEAMRSLQKDEGVYEVDDQSSFDALLAATLDASARMDVSATTKADHIRFSSRENIPAERRALMTERFRARAALRRYYEARSAEDSNFADGQDFETFFTQSSAAMGEGLLENQAEQDGSYKKLSNRLALKSALRGMIFGAALGEVIQESTAFVNSEVRGAFENSHESTDTLLSAAWRSMAGQFEQHAPAHDVGTTITSGHNQLDLGKGLSYDGGTLIGPDGLKVEGLSIGENGFDEASIAKLHAAGVEYNDTLSHVAQTTEATHAVDTSSYMQQHGHHVERTWDDNDTPSVSDGNELRADFGVDNQGNYIVSASRMVQGDSFHNGRVANINFGHMKVLLSPTVETQATPLVLDMDAQGNVIIPKGSVAEQWFAKGAGGAPIFRGAYVEVAQDNGNGQYEVLATAVGTGDAIPSVTERVTQTTSIAAHHSSLFFTPKPVTPDIELPPVISIDSRGGLRREGEAPVEPQGPSPEVPSLAEFEGRGPQLELEGRLEQLALESRRERRYTAPGEITYIRPLAKLESRQSSTSRRPTPERATLTTTAREQLQLTSRESPRHQREERVQRLRQQQENLRQRRERAFAERTIKEERSEGLVNEAGLTPYQLAQEHPDYVVALQGARADGKEARRRASKTLKRLIGYYERYLMARRNEEPATLDPNEQGINIHERADRDPRYIALRKQADDVFASEMRERRGAARDSEMTDAQRRRVSQLVAARHAIEHDLDVVKQQLLKEFDTEGRGRSA